MKFKLTYEQFTALYNLFQEINHKYVADDMHDKLLHVLSTNIFMRLYKMAIRKKDKYNLKFAEEEALAFWLLTNDHKMDNASFLGNTLNMMNMAIHQKFAV